MLPIQAFAEKLGLEDFACADAEALCLRMWHNKPDDYSYLVGHTEVVPTPFREGFPVDMGDVMRCVTAEQRRQEAIAKAEQASGQMQMDLFYGD